MYRIKEDLLAAAVCIAVAFVVSAIVVVAL